MYMRYNIMSGNVIGPRRRHTTYLRKIFLSFNRVITLIGFHSISYILIFYDTQK
jgi:hypothetical protein